jgi:hypothetical protein
LIKNINDSTTHLNIISSVNIKQIFINNTKNGIRYLDKLEKKQKFKSVHRYVDFLRSCLTPLILNLTEGEEMYVLLLKMALKKELQENFQIINLLKFSICVLVVVEQA